MITIISGTNRPNSRTALFAHAIKHILSELTDDQVNLLNLTEIPIEAYHNDMYNLSKQHKALTAIQENYIIPADKWIVLSPEYNGSYTGILKLFIDAMSVSMFGDGFANKHVGLIGIATGRGGNARGLDHLTGAFHYLNMHVMPYKLPLSNIESHITNDVIEPSIQDVLKIFCDSFLAYNMK